jgi:hypothetical protein
LPVDESREHSYAREKFWTAIHGLATGSSRIQARLESAALCLHTLRPEDLPGTLSTDFANLWRDLTKVKAHGDEGTIAATTRQMSDEQAGELAGRIVSIYTNLHGGI